MAERPKQPPEHPAEHLRPVEDPDIDASLNEALSSLEQMLAQHRGYAAPAPEEAVEIPVLDQVVAPGSPQARPGPLAARLSHSRLIERLASELETIVQSAVDEAMNDARRTIKRRIREHLDIILPEILEEISLHHPEE